MNKPAIFISNMNTCTRLLVDPENLRSGQGSRDYPFKKSIVFFTLITLLRNATSRLINFQKKLRLVTIALSTVRTKILCL